MICPFCSQWNERVPGRCRFCGNRLEGERDETCEGAYGATGTPVTLPKALTTHSEEQGFTPIAGLSLSSLSGNLRVVAPILAIGGLILGMLALRACM